jgi:hypothetical protein
MDWGALVIWPIVTGLMIAALIGLWNFVTRLYQDPRKKSRTVIAKHIRRMIGEIDWLDRRLIETGGGPTPAHLQHTRELLRNERPDASHFESVGDDELEKKVRDWYTTADSSLRFEEAYVSNDENEMRRFGSDWAQWETMANHTRARHSNLIIQGSELADRLERKRKPQSKPRTPHVPPEAMLPSSMARAYREDRHD